MLHVAGCRLHVAGCMLQLQVAGYKFGLTKTVNQYNNTNRTESEIAERDLVFYQNLDSVPEIIFLNRSVYFNLET